MAGLPMLGAMFGLCLGGPVGLLAGVKLGGVAAVGGSILGYAGATVVREQRDLRTYIDEHYVREPELYVLSPREEALLARRLSVQEQRHLPPSRPGSRRGPAGYRRPSTASCSSGASARRRPGSLRAGREPRPAPPHLARPAPPHLARPSFRRLGDLPEAEQRSVMALIYSAQVRSGKERHPTSCRLSTYRRKSISSLAASSPAPSSPAPSSRGTGGRGAGGAAGGPGAPPCPTSWRRTPSP